LLFGIILPLLLLAGIKKPMAMRGFVVLLLLMNVILFFPMMDTEIRYSTNYDNYGSVGKYISKNIDGDKLIIFDDSMADAFTIDVYYALIDYWIPNDLRRANLEEIALSDDYTELKDGDYIITTLEGSTEPLYTSAFGLSLYYL
jgi:hypothetical protein